MKDIEAKLSEIQVVSYALPVVFSAMIMGPMAILQGIYAKHYGIALSTLALIVFCSRVFDAVSDPVIGYLSDRYRKKHGTRKPFIIIGILSLIICSYFLYLPVAKMTGTYIAIWFIALYMAFTLFEIPHITWPCDIVNDSSERAKCYSYRVVAGYSGILLFYVIPLLPIFPTNEITPDTLKITFFVAMVLAFPFLFQAMRAVPAGRPPIPSIDSRHHKRSQIFLKLFKEMINNKPFMIFVFAFIFGSFSAGMWFGLIYIYVDAYLHMGNQFSKMFLMAFVVGIAAAPFWYRIILKIGKKNTFFITMTMLVFSYIYTGTLEPGQTAFSELLLLKTIQVTAYVGDSIVIPGILAEIIDYADWKTGLERSATYFSVRVFFEKSAVAVGSSLALAIASGYGFVVTDSSFSEEAIEGLKLAIVWIPTLFGIVALLFVALTPIDERRHAIIKRRLDARLARSLVSNASQDKKRQAKKLPLASTNASLTFLKEDK